MNIDKWIILGIPIALIITLISCDGEIMWLISGVLLSVLAYELIIFPNYRLFGARGLRILSFPSLIAVSFFVFIAIPSIYITSTTLSPQRLTYFYAILLFLPLFAIGLRTGKLLFPIDEQRLEPYFKIGLVKSNFDHRFYELLIILFSVALGILMLYLLRVKTIPLFEMIRDPSAYKELFFLREKSMKLLEISPAEKYLFSWLKEILFPIGIVAGLSLFVIYKTKNYRLIFGLFLLAGLFNNSLTIAKMPTAAIVLMLVAFVYFYRQKFSLRFILASATLVMSFPFLVIYFASIPEIRQPGHLMVSLLSRLFIMPAEVLFYYFKYFPVRHEFLMGRSSNLFSWLHPEGHFNLENYVAQQWWGTTETSGYANAFFIGNFWADFGWLGIIFSILFIGIFSYYLYQRIVITSGYEKNIIYTTFTVSLIVTFSFSFISSTFTILFLTKGILLILCMLYFIRYMQIKGGDSIYYDLFAEK